MHHFSFMARYSAWVNERIYDGAAKLSDAAYRGDAKLFFGSVHATLNHVMVVDRLWTGRVEGKDRSVRALSQILHGDFASLRAARKDEDGYIQALMDRLSPADLEASVRYTTLEGETIEARRWDLLTGLFNHQTHHRGQIYAVLRQNGVALPELDVIYYLIETGKARPIT
jgi:uncharacterized damage-inducible protein DinB